MWEGHRINGVEHGGPDGLGPIVTNWAGNAGVEDYDIEFWEGGKERFGGIEDGAEGGELKLHGVEGDARFCERFRFGITIEVLR